MACNSEPEHPQLITRRHLGRLTWIIGGLLVIGAQVWWLLRLFFNPNDAVTTQQPIVVGNLEAFPIGSVTHFRKHRFLLVRQTTGVVALSQECTHNRCVVNYLQDDDILFCACHSARFSKTGRVLGGPAPRPLDRFPTHLRDGQVLVDTSRRLEMPTPFRG